MHEIIKQVIHIVYKKQFTPIVILSLFSLLIWYIGPLIVINNIIPLEQISKRVYAIFGICLTWILIVNLFDNKSRLNPALFFSPHNPELTKKLQALETRFRNTVNFLKKTRMKHDGNEMNLYHLPWYLVIGMPHSGKTTLLANAKIHYVLARKFKHDNIRTIPATEICDWWVTRDAVLLDIPGTYINSRLKNPANADNQPHHKISAHNTLWNNLLRLLKKHRGTHAIDGVIVTIPLPELIAQQHHGKERILLELKQRCADLRQQFGLDTPFYFIITKCDLIPGFLEFFGDIGTDERSQAWGITMPTTYDNERFADIFVARFNILINRLNKQLIWRLHQERNPAIKPQIKDFPLHIERLKDSILGALRTLEISETNLQIQGVYLTSGVQHPIETKTANVYEASTTIQLIHQAIMQPHKAFFIRQILLKGLTHTIPQAIPKLTFKWKDRPYLYSLCASILLLTVGFISNQFYQHIQETHALNSGLVQYQQAAQHSLTADAKLINTLPLLHALQQAASHSAYIPLTNHQQAVAAYHQALQKIILPQIKKDLAEYLTKTSNKNSQELYSALRAYLMLGDEERYQPDIVFNTIKQLSPALFTSGDFAQYLQTTLNMAVWQAQNVNVDIVTRARQKLLNLMPIDIGYAILKSYPENNLNNTTTISSTLSIPTFFTAATFTTTYNQQIPTAIIELTSNNWILGTGDITLDTTTLTAQLRARYISHYIDTWQSILTNIATPHPQNLAEVDATIIDMTSDRSSRLALLHIVKDNTNFQPVLANSLPLAEINKFMDASDEKNKNAFSQMLLALNQLHGDLQRILQTNHSDEEAFKVAVTRMSTSTAGQDTINQLLQIADNSPMPIKTLLNNISATSWHYVLQEAGQFIQKHWQTDVMAIYNSQLANRFPFAADATDEVSLSQFGKFLGTQGILIRFFQTYLQPFADNTNKIWVWKIINNQHMPFSDLALNQIQHASKLQRMLFPNGDNQAMSLKNFSLSENLLT